MNDNKITVDFEALDNSLGADLFFYTFCYYHTCADKTKTEKDKYSWYTSMDKAEQGIRNLSWILGWNETRLVSLLRSIRKWQEKAKWEKCFPYKNHHDAFVKYLTLTKAERER